MSATIEQAKKQNNAVAMFKAAVVSLYHSSDDNAGMAMKLALNALEEMMEPKEFIAFCDEIYSM